jgi:hypothetical protein
MKALFGMALRHTTSYVVHLLKQINLNLSAPNSSMLCRRHECLAVNISNRGATGPLHPLIDESGGWLSRTKPHRNHFHCISLVGQGLMATRFKRSVVELHIRIAILNLFTASRSITVPLA